MSISHTENSTSKASELPSHLYLLSEQRDQDGATHHHDSMEWGQGKHWSHWVEWRPTVLKKEEVSPFWRWRNWGTGSLNILWNRQSWASNPCSAPCLCSFNPRRQSYFLNLGLWGLQGPRNALHHAFPGGTLEFHQLFLSSLVKKQQGWKVLLEGCDGRPPQKWGHKR